MNILIIPRASPSGLLEYYLVYFVYTLGRHDVTITYLLNASTDSVWSVLGHDMDFKIVQVE